MLVIIAGLGCAAAAVVTVCKTKCSQIWQLTLVLLLTNVFLSFVAIRPLVVSWLFLAATVRVVFDSQLWSRFRKFLPVLFLLWANVHGGFIAGIAVVGIYVFVNTLTSRRINLTDWLVLAGCVLVTLINPYGLGVWKEIWLNSSDAQTRAHIAEWLPAIGW